jgi:mediator of RNA polymerase II transcription subunit 4
MGYTVDIGDFADLIVSKHKELQCQVQVAREQEDFEKKIGTLRQDVDKEEEEIKTLQKKLKEAEHILATAIYQAKQKLKLIRKANENSIPSDELIKYAHKISSSHSVAAPYNWEQGDPRRPYPTDMEMKLGLIGQSPDFQLNTSQTNPSTGNTTPNTPFDGPVSATGTTAFFWNQTAGTSNTSGDIKLGSNSFSNIMDVKANGSKDNLEDVEVMSTDSSSSSSSDSQ